MSILTAEVREALERAVLCWFASVDREGAPNVSPKEVFAALDDRRIAVANIASPRTARNVRADGRVCVSFVDVFVQRGFKLTGAASLVQPGDAEFETIRAPLRAIAGDRFHFINVIVVEVSKVEPIVAPSYRFFPDTAEADQVRAAMDRYGVRPRDERSR